MEIKKQNDLSKKTNQKKILVGVSQSGSYILQPYKLVKDIGTNFTKQLANPEKVLNGEIDDFSVKRH